MYGISEPREDLLQWNMSLSALTFKIPVQQEGEGGWGMGVLAIETTLYWDTSFVNNGT